MSASLVDRNYIACSCVEMRWLVGGHLHSWIRSKLASHTAALATMTLWKTVCRPASQRPRWRRTRSAYNVCEHLASTSWMWSEADRFESELLQGYEATIYVLYQTTVMVSMLSVSFSYHKDDLWRIRLINSDRLLLRAQVSTCSSPSVGLRVCIFSAGITKYVSSANFTCSFPALATWRSAAVITYKVAQKSKRLLSININSY